jgi:hypothetical protein
MGIKSQEKPVGMNAVNRMKNAPLPEEKMTPFMGIYGQRKGRFLNLEKVQIGMVPSLILGMMVGWILLVMFGLRKGIVRVLELDVFGMVQNVQERTLQYQVFKKDYVVQRMGQVQGRLAI